ncbi:MAG: hypothetical protein GY730_00875 [bacterium]|nr:hypothetical protein [bacterium]
MIETSNNYNRLKNFIVFEPLSLRLKETDIFLRGDEVIKMVWNINNTIGNKDDLKSRIMKNKLSKFEKMFSLLKSNENLVMTKFFDNIWRRYSFVSNLGESFLEIPCFYKIYPEYGSQEQDIIAQRINFDEDMDLTEENNTEETETVSEEESKEVAEDQEKS